MTEYIATIAQELSIKPQQVQATIGLLEDDATVPFIARYRKEVTGSLDEVAITGIRDRLHQLMELDKRREAILKSLEEQGKLTDELKDKVASAATMTELEDIYLPYKPKRRTRATMAKEKGLEPLAELLWSQDAVDVHAEAAKYIDPAKEVAAVEDALAGARDIIAERISEDQTAREKMRAFYRETAKFVSRVVTGKEEEGAKFKDYFEWEEPLATAPSHRVLAMRRGEHEEVLSLRVVVEEDAAVALLESLFIKAGNDAAQQVRLAIADGFKRLLSISIATEMRLETKKKADETAIRVFTDNLRELLLASPLGEKAVLGLDPGFRTGCKVVCLNPQGKLVHHDVIYLPQVSNPAAAAKEGVKLLALCDAYKIEAVAIGNGTASRETEAFVKSIGLPKSIVVVMVNESGASIYSASDAAREEFPDYDVTVRGSVSIARRLMDPLAELVKIDPKSIGVGQYQHDVDQAMLKQSLDDVVISCVNNVGVEVNTASKQLLSYVSGLGASLAQNIVTYRNENGPFKSRDEFKKVPRLGPKAFEQAAGFLRIRDAENPLDGSAVHPESYAIVDAIAGDLRCSVRDLVGNKELHKQINFHQYVTDSVGLPTLMDIREELAKPGRDPRKQFEAVQFAEGVNTVEDLEVGMKLPGVVTNVTAFGAFVDIGVHQDGLVHISQLADHFVKDPNEVVKVQQHVQVTVLEVDLGRKRIALSMKKDPAASPVMAGGSRREPAASRQVANPQPSGRGKMPLSNLGGGLRLGDLIREQKKK